jgi:hypothetical protein
MVRPAFAAIAAALSCAAAGPSVVPALAKNFYSDSCWPVDVARVGVFEASPAASAGGFSVLATESRPSAFDANAHVLDEPTAACKSTNDHTACPAAAVAGGQVKAGSAAVGRTLFSAGKPDGSDNDFQPDVLPADVVGGSGEVWWDAALDPVSSFPRQIVTVLVIKFPAPLPSANQFMWRGTQLEVRYLKVDAAFDVTVSVTRTSDARLAMAGFRDFGDATRWRDVGTQSVQPESNRSTSGAGSKPAPPLSGLSSINSLTQSSSNSRGQGATTLRFDISEDTFWSPELFEPGAVQEPAYWAVRIYSSRERAAIYDSVQLIQRQLSPATQQPVLSDANLRAYVVQEDGWQSPGSGMHFDEAAGGKRSALTVVSVSCALTTTRPPGRYTYHIDYSVH